MNKPSFSSPSKKSIVATVPCNGCSLCCTKGSILLHPELGDDPSQYQTETHPNFPGRAVIAHKPTGECIYLNDTGCSIHDRAPAHCREFDCRKIETAIGFTATRKLVKKGLLSQLMVIKGRQLRTNTEKEATP
jgi:hypothetical protein